MILTEMAILLGGILGAVVAQTPTSKSATVPLHVSNTFEFTVKEPQEKVAPLFGAHKERMWAEGWNPQFIFPQPAEDRQGSVFKISHGSHESTWITTIFDLQSGHVQYTYVIPEVMAVLIDIHLAPAPQSGTHVTVLYERTALSPESNDHVSRQGEQDANSAEEWRMSIEGYFERRKAK